MSVPTDSVLRSFEVREIAESWAKMMSESSIKIKVIVFDGCSYPEKESEKVKRYRDRKKTFRRFSIAREGATDIYIVTKRIHS